MIFSSVRGFWIFLLLEGREREGKMEFSRYQVANEAEKREKRKCLGKRG